MGCIAKITMEMPTRSPFGGDEKFDKYLDYKDRLTGEEVDYISEEFIKGTIVPFNVLYNAMSDFAVSQRGELIGNKGLFADPDRYRDLARSSSRDTIEYLSERKDKMLDGICILGQIWHRRFHLCELDNFDLMIAFHELHSELPNSMENRIAFLEELVAFHIQAQAIQKIDEYIWDERKQSGKIQFFSSKLSNNKLLAVKKVLLDCKGANYDEDKHFLAPLSDDDWLYIFGRKYVTNPTKPKWCNSDQALMSTMGLICGSGATLKPLVKLYFGIQTTANADHRRIPKILDDNIKKIIES